MPTTSRRVSYVLSPPAAPVPHLALPPLDTPRHGSPRPILQARAGDALPRDPPGASADHPRHCLGVAALALDTTTQLAGRGSPEGVLYTGGRDGLVAAWELGLRFKRRERARWRAGRKRRVDWERLEDGAAWDEEAVYEDEEGEQSEASSGSSDEGSGSGEEGEEAVNLMGGDGGRNGRYGRQKGRHANAKDHIPFEDTWQVDAAALEERAPPPTVFRQSIQTHTDWVNDLLLCNMNQTVVTASSDRTIRAWSPHSSTESGTPGLIGVHRDYAKTLSLASQAEVLFSGGLDRQIAAWDLKSPRPDVPLTRLLFPETSRENSAGGVYALASNPMATLVAAGTPEKVVRLWDPRAGGGDAAGVHSVSKLVGHTDNIRALCLSEDGRYLLSGSSDCTVKLWSLSAQRCLQTFSHHTDSVWALFSDHPNLERFYSGDRSGYLCVTDLEGCQTDLAEAECVLLAQEELEDHRQGTQGICQISALDDEFVWTATGAAAVKRWRDVGRKSSRQGMSQPVLKGSNLGNSTPQGGSQLGHGGGTPAISLSPSNPTTTRAKRISFEGGSIAAEQLQSLLRTESRDSRTVAFAPEPSTSGRTETPRRVASFIQPSEHQNSSSSIPKAVSSSQRRTTASGAPIATSVMSIDSVPDNSPIRNGLPYASQICLGVPDTPYLPSRPDGASPYSGSMYSLGHAGMSASPAQNNFAIAAASRSSFQHHRAPSASSYRSTFANDPVEMARREFVSREVAEEATPIRDSPDEVILGRHGLIRAAMLNDRQHVITVDTSGEIAVWNIIKGVCIGRFRSDDVAAIVGHVHDGKDHKQGPLYVGSGQINPREALEIVRDRIEGESMTVTWCSVDTRIGSLTVHLEEARCFDAEVYADEVGFDKADYKEDHRINLGKWVLSNLFAGLVKAEGEDIARHNGGKPAAASGEAPNAAPSTSIHRLGAPLSIPIEPVGPSPNRRLRSLSSLSASVPATPGGHLMSTPAMTPAILPAINTPRTDTNTPWPHIREMGGPLAAIPQSPVSVPIPTNSSVTDTPQAAKSPRADDGAGGKDYFSFRSGRPKAVATTNSESSPTRTTAETPAQQVPSTPGATPGGGLMGRFKGFGSKSKKASAAESNANAMPSMPEDGEGEDEKKDEGPLEGEAAQLQILAAVRSHPFYPPPDSEAPSIVFPSDTAVLISEETKDSGAWAVAYRSMVGRTEDDIEPLEMAAPAWVLEYLFAGRGRLRDPVKLCFLLEPFNGVPELERLPAMPANNSRLTANRVLRVRKVVQYICEKLELGAVGGPRRDSAQSGHSNRPSTAPAKSEGISSTATPAPFASIRKLGTPASPNTSQSHSDAWSATGDVTRPEDMIEVLCCGVVVPVTMTLAAVRQYIWNARGGGIGDVVLYYRRRGVAED